MKKIFRWIGLTIFGYALILALLLTANAFVFTIVTSNPDRVKAILNDSGVYQNIPDVAFDNLNTEGAESSALNTPEVKKAAKEVFNAEFFQSAIDSGVSGAYAWLSGESDTINFSVDLTKQKEEFIDKAVAYRVASLESLPTCSAAQLSGDVDIFTINCNPPYQLDAEQLKQQARGELSKGEDFLARGSFSAEELKNENGKAFYDSMPKLPEQFQAAKNLPYVLIFFAALLSVGIIYISETKKRGLLSLSRVFIVSGVFTLFAPRAISYLSEKILAANSSNQPTKDIVLPLLNEFNSSTAYIYYWVGGVSIILGIVGLLAYSGRLKMPKGLSR